MLNNDEIKNILSDIRESMQRDVDPILKVYLDKNNWANDHWPGFWTIPRILFPEVDGLGRLRYGRSTDCGSSKSAVDFMREYFPRPEYKKISGFIYNVYRHGLMHSHSPKEMIINGKNRGWRINLSSHSSSLHLKFQDSKEKIFLNLGMMDFYEDFLNAIDKYIKEFDDQKREAELVALFNEAYCIMRSPEIESEARNRKFLDDSDFDFFN